MIPDNLQTMRLSMRPFAEGDGSAVYAYWQSDPGWVRFNASVPEGFTESDADSFVREMSSRDRAQQPNWALVHDQEVVGVLSLSFEEAYRIASIGYGIHARLRGHGLCAEAAQKVLDCAFTAHPELKEVRAHTDARNGASIRVLRKLSFSQARPATDDERAHNGTTLRLQRSEWIRQCDVSGTPDE